MLIKLFIQINVIIVIIIFFKILTNTILLSLNILFVKIFVRERNKINCLFITFLQILSPNFKSYFSLQYFNIFIANKISSNYLHYDQ